MRSRRRVSVVLALVAASTAVTAGDASAWTGAQRLSAYTSTSDGGKQSARGPVVGFDATGRATAIWTETADITNSQSWSIRRAELPAGSTDRAAWVVDPTPVSGPGATAFPEQSAPDPDITLAVGADGHAVAAWLMNDAAASLQAAGRADPSGPFGSPVTLTNANAAAPAGSCKDPQTDNFGPVATPGHLFWIGKCDSFTAYRVFARTVNGGAIGASSIELAEGVWDTDPSTKVGTHAGFRNGVSHAVWAGDNGASTSQQGLMSRSINAGGQPGPFVQHDPSFTGADKHPRIGVLPDGRSVVSYHKSSTQEGFVRFGEDEPVKFADAGVFRTELAVGADGTVVVAWTTHTTEDAWQVRVMPPPGAPGAGVFGPAHKLMPPGGNPHHLRLAVSDNGVGYAVWVRNDGANDILEASILDPADPNRSPGHPYQFQPVQDQIFTGIANGPVVYYAALTPSLAVDPKGNAAVTAAIQVGANPAPDRYAAVAILNPTPRTGGTPPDDGTPPVITPPGGDPPPGGGGNPPPGGGPAADTTKPRITAFSLSRNYFAVGRKFGKTVVVHGKNTFMGFRNGLKVGTKVRFTLTEAARVKVTVEQTGCWHSYDNVREICRPASKKTRLVYRKTRTGKRGKNAFAFTGDDLLKGRRMVPGGWYTFTLVATDAAGNKSAKKKVERVRIDAAR